MNRARSFSQETLSEMLSDRDYTLKYGEPLVYNSRHYNVAPNSGASHLFICGDSSNSAASYSPDVFHVGPYYGETGIEIDNRVNSANLGAVRLKIAAGTGISITDGTGANAGSKVITATGQSQAQDQVVFLHYDDTQGVMLDDNDQTVTPQDIAGYINNDRKFVVCTYNSHDYYPALSADAAHLEFVCDRYTNSDLNAIWCRDGQTWTVGGATYNDIVKSDEWQAIELTTGTTYVIQPNVRRKCYLIDNRYNTKHVTVSIDQSGMSPGDVIYSDTETNWNVIAPGGCKLFQVKKIDNTHYYIVSEAVSGWEVPQNVVQ